MNHSLHYVLLKALFWSSKQSEPINGDLKTWRVFSTRVVASWIKLLVIMHADKIGAKKENNLSWWILKFWLEPFVFLEIHRRSPHHRPSKDIPKIKDKIDTKNHEKVILILQRVISVFKIQGNQRTTLNNVCWIFDQTSLISKNTFQNWHLSDFISTIRFE
jgi:hypothetical protein